MRNIRLFLIFISTAVAGCFLFATPGIAASNGDDAPLTSDLQAAKKKNIGAACLGLAVGDLATLRDGSPMITVMDFPIHNKAAITWDKNSPEAWAIVPCSWIEPLTDEDGAALTSTDPTL